MGDLRRTVMALASLAVVVFVIAAVFVSALYAFAILAPILGLAFATNRASAALQLWRSGGRFQIGDGVRIIGAGRARVLAVLIAVEAIAGLMLSCVPARFVFGARPARWLLLGGGLAAYTGSRAAHARVLRDAHAVDVLPPE